MAHTIDWEQHSSKECAAEIHRNVEQIIKLRNEAMELRAQLALIEKIVAEADPKFFEENALGNNWYERLVEAAPPAAPVPLGYGALTNPLVTPDPPSDDEPAPAAPNAPPVQISRQTVQLRDLTGAADDKPGSTPGGDGKAAICECGHSCTNTLCSQNVNERCMSTCYEKCTDKAKEGED